MRHARKLNQVSSRGFTLIELSIVLVIIGLIVGGVLVGQDLIRAAGVRATITQIEKYNTAVNTFRGKFNALPGDMNATTASQFGFHARGSNAGEGDGNGIIEGYNAGNDGLTINTGETSQFWCDLSLIGLIDGGFSTNRIATAPGFDIASTLPTLFPAAKIGRGNYIYVWSGGYVEWNNDGPPGDGINYYGIGIITAIPSGVAQMNMGLTVGDAYNIDKKVDDGFPQTGRVTAMFNGGLNDWASFNASDSIQSANGLMSAEYGPATSGDHAGGSPDSNSIYTCYDSPNTPTISFPLVYSVSTNAQRANCALSFQFQ